MTDAEIIKGWREGRGLGIVEAARRLAVNHATLWRWETGRARPKGHYRKALIAAGIGIAETRDFRPSPDKSA